MKARTVLEGCGVGIIAAMPYIWPQFSPYHSGIYHSMVAMNSVAWGALIDVAVVSAIAILIFAYLEKRGTPYRSLIWALIAARFASVFIQFYSLLLSRQFPIHIGPEMSFWIVLVTALALRWLQPPGYEVMAKGFSMVLAMAGFCVFWVVPELLYQGMLPAPVDPPVKMISTGGATASQGRIVWILFDEMSYDQTFEHRFPGLEMPFFDQLKGESVLFSDVTPAGYSTEHVLPALFLGRIVKNSQSDLRGNLSVKFAGQSGWHRFDPNATIFADALRLGWSDGLVGWFNPYCRILPGVLNYCYWNSESGMAGDVFVNGVTPERTALENAMAPIAAKVPWLRPDPTFGEKEHERSLAEIMAQAEKLIENGNIRFVFIHLPVPHPPGIFDRTTGRIRGEGSYIDNLALADRSLGELMATLKATPYWSKTTLIVSSDHSWRVAIWKNQQGWSKEDETASQGKFDPRPMLMIRYPEHVQGIDIHQPFQDIQLHTVLDQMMQGKLQSPAELEGWLHDSSKTTPNSLPPAKPASGN